MTRLVAAASRPAPSTRGRPSAMGVLGPLIGLAVMMWLLLVALGEFLTRVVNNTAFERWDGSVDRTLARHRTSTWNMVTHWMTEAASTYTVVAAGVLIVLVLLLARRGWRASSFVAVALVGEVTIFVATTLVVDRHRPSVPRLDAAPPTSSFPSGHTAAAVILYGAVAVLVCRYCSWSWLRTLAVALAVVAPLAVASSRLYRGMHYPTDVLSGALLGLVWLAVTSTLVLGRST